jgi:hypothetical protein
MISTQRMITTNAATPMKRHPNRSVIATPASCGINSARCLFPHLMKISYVGSSVMRTRTAWPAARCSQTRIADQSLRHGGCPSRCHRRQRTSLFAVRYRIAAASFRCSDSRNPSSSVLAAGTSVSRALRSGENLSRGRLGPILQLDFGKPDHNTCNGTHHPLPALNNINNSISHDP